MMSYKLHVAVHTHIYVYVYLCVCMCVCVHACKYNLYTYTGICDSVFANVLEKGMNPSVFSLAMGK